MRLIVDQWFMEDNLWPLYRELSDLVKYDFDQLDIDAIKLGLEGVDESRGIWFDYQLIGNGQIDTRITIEPGSSCYQIQIRSDSDIDREVQLLLNLCQDWRICEF